MEKELKDGMYVISPMSNLFFTKGKKYKVEDVREITDRYRYKFDTVSDLGGKINCILNECSCIDCKDWIISDTPPIKDTFTREEVIEFGLKCLNLGMDLKNNPSLLGDGNGKDYYYNWIKENL